MNFILTLSLTVLMLHICIGEDAHQDKHLLLASSDKTTTSNSTGMEQHRWNGSDTAGNICVMMDAAIRLSFTSNTTGVKSPSAPVDVPANPIIDSHDCSNSGDIERLDLNFIKEGYKWTLGFLFSKGNDQNSLQNLTVTLVPTDVVTPVTYTGNVNLGFTAPNEDSFKCNSHQDYNIMGVGDWPFNVSTLSVEKLQWQAFFTNKTNPKYDTAHICTNDMTTNDLVPIIVGACLAGLVIIVLIAYLIGRARVQRSTGYESV